MGMDKSKAKTRMGMESKIQMGLIPPPEPKVKLSNLARVLGEQAVADPSKIEKYVKEQMAERLNKHNDICIGWKRLGISCLAFFNARHSCVSLAERAMIPCNGVGVGMGQVSRGSFA